MAKQSTPDTIESYSRIKEDILAGHFSPLYMLMGEESYYTGLLCNLIVEKALRPEERDFNQTILYGADTNASEIASVCQRFPMMAERQLVVIKEAQALKKLEPLEKYIQNPASTTVLVLLFSGKGADKRTSFYKNAVKAGTLFESAKLRDEVLPRWIEQHFVSLNKKIEPQAAALLADYAGNDLRKIDIECQKLIRAVDTAKATITAEDIEKNVGVSREFNTIELANALAVKDAKKSFKIAYYFGESPKKYPIQMTTGYLFFFFSKVELIHAHAAAGPRARIEDAAKRAGFFGYYGSSFITAAKNYNLGKTMKIISLIKECDYKSKSNFGGNASDGDLLTELIGRILS